MLEVSQLTRRYDRFTAVDNVSFTIKKCEIVGLLGHNGAGKTTIMKMLSGFLEPNQGTIHIDGIDLQTETKQLQQNLGYLPENLPLYPEMTVADYLDYVAELKGLTGANKFAEIKRTVQATEITEKLLAPIATLSRGYKQRVGVAQAVLGKPKLLILDEPTNGLDPTQTAHMRQLIQNIAKDAAVILSTHIMQEVDAICDRVLILSSGKLAVDETLDALRRSHFLLLSSNLTPESTQTLLSPLAGIQQIDVSTDSLDQSDHFSYRIKIADEYVIETISAAIANAVVGAGAELYQLKAEKRDLESLFREAAENPALANNKKEVNDAP